MRPQNGTNRAKAKLVTRRFPILVLRFFMAALLLTSAAPASTILCVGSTGHSVVEEWAARCCANSAPTSGAAFRDVSPCHGCTDYVITTEVGAESMQPEPSSPLTDEQLPFSAAVLPQQPSTAVQPHLNAAEVTRVPLSPAPSSISLRC